MKRCLYPCCSLLAALSSAALIGLTTPVQATVLEFGSSAA